MSKWSNETDVTHGLIYVDDTLIKSRQTEVIKNAVVVPVCSWPSLSSKSNNNSGFEKKNFLSNTRES